MSKRPRVQVTLEYVGAPEQYDHKLKAALKVLGRTFHLRCVGLVSVTELLAETTKEEVCR